MHKRFNHQDFEKKWQEYWAQEGIYRVGHRDTAKEKEYILVEWPYPSGNLHIGHWYAFAVPDIYVRYRRMSGKQVLYPMGFDAFGLPAENAAIKHQVNPREWTERNISYMEQQLASMGNAFSWDKTCNSTDPEYFKWTQWMFTKFFEAGIAYRGEGVVNWDPVDNTVIANEQVLPDGTSERSGALVEKRVMPQWMLRITDFADALIDDLDDLDWAEPIKEAQRQWIGRSKGAVIDFKLQFREETNAISSAVESVSVFTTRPDTLFGVTYLVLAPEHPYVEKYKDQLSNWDAVAAYVQAAKQKSDIERGDNTKEKTGVKLEGISAINPVNNEAIPVYIADYVLGGYGTGAIMAVPAHDERDQAFARKFNLPIRTVVAPQPVTHAGALLAVKGKPGSFILQQRDLEAPYLPGVIGFFGGKLEAGESTVEAAVREVAEETELEISLAQITNTYTVQSTETPEYQLYVLHVADVDPTALTIHEGMAVEMTVDEILTAENVSGAVKQVVEQFLTSGTATTDAGYLIGSQQFDGLATNEAKEQLIKAAKGRASTTYRLRDWSIGRQRYWGVPIPIVYDPEGKAHPVPAEHLPWTLPTDVDFTPTGEPPLAKSEELKARTERLFGPGWTPEVETMDTFVDSSWYFLRYLDNQNGETFSSLAVQQAWLPVDTYFGGAEHTTMHLLYSRFWQKALHQLGLVTHHEPYQKRINRGLILGPDGNKMSKSKGNVIDPDEQVRLVGADTVKMYLAFMGPYQGSNYPWDPGGVVGLRRFLERVHGLSEHIQDEARATTKLLHKTIEKVTTDIVDYKFNTAISAMMIFLNQAEKEGITSADYLLFLRTLAPFAPHLTEELWAQAGQTGSIHQQAFPVADPALLVTDSVTIGVQVNGKVRGQITISPTASETEAVEAAQGEKTVQSYLAMGELQKVIYVPGRILNLIVKT